MVVVSRSAADMKLAIRPIQKAFDSTLADLTSRGALRRIWDRDHTLWPGGPEEVADRLGWLDSPAELGRSHSDLDSFASEAIPDFDRVVVLGMGGSSLFAEVIGSIRDPDANGLPISVLDTTHPSSVARALDRLQSERVLFVVASKSGTTIETACQMEAAWARLADGTAFVAVTDPGTELEALARAREFRAVFLNREDIGGRYSALSYFGMVPAALAGRSLDDMMASARAELEANGPEVDASAAPGVMLGAVLAAGAARGRDKLTLVFDGECAALGPWIEQLVAESLGKDGDGIVPVVGEPYDSDGQYGEDRLFVCWGSGTGGRAEELREAGHPVVVLDGGMDDLGAAVVRWEIATAVCGAAMEVNPFDQPDVGVAKRATADVLASGPGDIATGSATEVLDLTNVGDYVALLAFVDPTESTLARLEAARMAIAHGTGLATTVGIGPRFLHSTGQLHKGGADNGVFIQIFEDPDSDLDVPGKDYGFADLFRAQAAGDLRALSERARRVVRVTLEDLEAGAADAASHMPRVP